MHPYVGDLVGERYRILRGIGRGTSGEVFLAADQRIPDDAANRVVVKILSRVATDSVQRRFMNEVRAARRAKSRHCVTVYDAGSHCGASYLVMEYLAGQTLKDRVLKGGQLPIDAAITLGEQVADALEDVHAAGIVHRDVKPENLMILSEAPFFVKVLDFGIAHLADDGETLSAVGTPRYMAPEQIMHRPVDARTDIYALGTCLYELLAHKAPFQAESIDALLEAKLTQTPSPLARVRREIPPHIAALVDQMIQRDAVDRPRTMHEVARRLRAAAPSSPKKRTSIPALVAVAGVSVAFAVVGVPLLAERAPTKNVAVARDLPPLVTANAKERAAPSAPIAQPIVESLPKIGPSAQALPTATAARASSSAAKIPNLRRPESTLPQGNSVAITPAPSSSVIFRSGELRRDEL